MPSSQGEFVGTLGEKNKGEDVEIYWFYKYDGEAEQASRTHMLGAPRSHLWSCLLLFDVADILGPKFFLHEQELGKSMHYPDRIPGPSINGRAHVAQLDSAAELVSK